MFAVEETEPMLNRRAFCQIVSVSALCTAAGHSLRAEQPRKRMAIICTHWIMQSHAQHMGDRFLTGYPRKGRWHRPPLEVVSLYVDQKPAGDQSAERAREFGFTIYPTIAEALCSGGDRLAVDAVLIIGEHGDYPVNARGQKQYPRYEFFKQVVDVFRRSGKSVPVFNDKHLSWNFAWAQEMVALAQELRFPLLAGSSLPVTWRMPAVDLPYGAQVEEALVVGFGPLDIYDFHALETLQAFVERRHGGETGVAWVEVWRGDAVWQALTQPDWDRGGIDPQLFEACLSRCQTLAQARPGFGHRYPTSEELRQLVPEPIAYRIQYRDGTRATVLMLNGLVKDFTFAARLHGQPERLSTLVYLPPQPNVVYSAALMSKVEEMFLTGHAPWPVERTLLTSGLVSFGLQSLFEHSRRLETPELAIRYVAPRESQFWRE
jgi:hypothetical protein